jgi:phosphoribosylformimino-5-aminoimidazole carboxamide ribotide isomerase
MQRRLGVQIIPAVDVLGGDVVRLHRGSFEAVTRYGDDPVAVGRRWMEAGAELIHLVDLDGARRGILDLKMISGFASAGIAFQVGGGIRDAVGGSAALAAGARRVVMGSLAATSPTELAGIGGPEQVVAALDIAEGVARVEGWLGAGPSWQEGLARLAETGVVWILVTSIVRDGTMAGPDFKLLGEVKAAHPELKLMASGGIGTLEDLRRLAGEGYAAAIVGRALYERAFTLEEALAAGS